MGRHKKKDDEKMKNLLQMKVPDGVIEKLEEIAKEEAKRTGIQRSVGVVGRELLSSLLLKKK